MGPIMSVLASIDIGSNTVKLLVAEVGSGRELKVVAREKELVRLGHETFLTGRLSAEAVQAGTDAIDRLVRRARTAGAEAIRAVATCAVREAENAEEFVQAVRARCGLEVEVISGEEEARLITLGVRSEFPASCDPVFLIDIGGGSTELVVFDGERVLFAESLELGAVRLAEKYLRNDPPTREEWNALKRVALRRAAAACRKVRKTGFKTCVGSSGTIQSLSMVYEAAIRGRDIYPSGHRTLPIRGLRKVNRILRRTTLKEKLKVPGLDPRRRDIALPGGAALSRILKLSGAREILTGERGLREGLLLDFAARRNREVLRPAPRDVREASVDALARRLNYEVLHAKFVAGLADRIFESTHPLHQMTQREREWLRFAALLHDVGSSVGYSRHHRHSYYLITHGGLTGFSVEEIQAIAAVARYHRGALPRKSHEEWKGLDPWRRHSVEKLAAILRIADGLDRSHDRVVELAACRLRQKKVILEVSAAEDIRPEIEAAMRKGDLFQKVFGRKMECRFVPAVPAERKGMIA